MLRSYIIWVWKGFLTHCAMTSFALVRINETNILITCDTRARSMAQEIHIQYKYTPAKLLLLKDCKNNSLKCLSLSLLKLLYFLHAIDKRWWSSAGKAPGKKIMDVTFNCKWSVELHYSYITYNLGKVWVCVTDHCPPNPHNHIPGQKLDENWRQNIKCPVLLAGDTAHPDHCKLLLSNYSS